MHLKDYYRILELEPSATLSEIKTAYRKLAMQYHPDKKLNDPGAAAQFTEIKEAYEVLSNPIKKEYYLQQRWYNLSSGKKKFSQPVTPVSVLQQMLELDRYVSTLDIHRLDKQGLFEYLSGILPDEAIEKLNSFNDPTINKEIAGIFINCSHPLPPHLLNPLANRIMKIVLDRETIQNINQYMENQRLAYRWEKYRPILILLIVLLLSLLIYFIGR
jgi:molecular chaperone DnaJ